MADNAVTVILEDRELAALDGYRRDLGPSASRADALAAILAEWISQTRDAAVAGPSDTDEGMRPSELNSSNDI